MKKLKVFVRVPPVADCGVAYYRQWLPMKIAEENGEVEMKCEKFTFAEAEGEEHKELTDEQMQEYGSWADIMYWSRNDAPAYIAQAGGMSAFYRIPSVLDLDDNVQATRPYNPGFRSFHPNSPHMGYNIKSVGVFDTIIVSTKDLYDYYKFYTNPDKIFVCPNSLDWVERDEVYARDFSSELFAKQPGEIRIGWSGSSAHYENLRQMEKPLLEILRRYPNTTFYYTGLFGELFQDKQLIQEGRIKKVGWSSLRQWPVTNREMNLDIALAPLADNMFNRAKSNLRLLEYGSAHFATIASPVSPYKCFTKDEVLFAMERPEWYNSIEKLVVNPSLRKELGENLYQRCKKDFDIRKNYKIWMKALRQSIKDYVPGQTIFNSDSSS